MFRVFGFTRFAKTLALTIWFVQIAAAACSQSLAETPWFSRQAGVGVEWKHYQFENLYGNRQSVSLIIADLDTPGVQVRFAYLPATRQRTSAMIPAQLPSAVAGVNGSFFDTSAGGGGSTTYLRINNTEITNFDQNGDYSDVSEALRGGVTIEEDETVRVQRRPNEGWASVINRRDILVQGPLLLRNQDRQNAESSFCTARHPRTFVGKTPDNKIILATVDGRTNQSAGMTCEEMQTLMLELGCEDATNMDGGGSSTMWVAGEPNNGVVNYPSDNGKYDHLGERSVSNCIAIIATPAPAALIDARLSSTNFDRVMLESTTQSVVVKYTNTGLTAWTSNTVTLNVTRPRTRHSAFYHDTWTSSTTPARLDEATVPPGATGTFRFVVAAPDVQAPVTMGETFGLVHESLGIFGPADNEPRLEFFVVTPSVPLTESGIIESREGGQNYVWYEETVGAWAEVNTDCTAPGLTPGIGQRYASTFRSVAGAKHATFTPHFASSGTYNVEITYGEAGSFARNGITYKVVHASGSNSILVDQTQNKNTWVSLGQYGFNAGTDGYVEINNSSIDVSGNMYSTAVRFTRIPQAGIDEWTLY